MAMFWRAAVFFLGRRRIRSDDRMKFGFIVGIFFPGLISIRDYRSRIARVLRRSRLCASEFLFAFIPTRELRNFPVVAPCFDFLLDRVRPRVAPSEAASSSTRRRSFTIRTRHRRSLVRARGADS